MTTTTTTTTTTTSHTLAAKITANKTKTYDT